MSLVFGVLKIGAAYLPLDPQYPEDVIKKVQNITFLDFF